MNLTLEQLQSAASGDLLKMVERRHPEYASNIEHWTFLQDTFKGGRKWFEKNLFRGSKEGPKEFRDRKKRAFRFPHTREVVNLVNKYVLKGIVERSTDAPEEVKRFWKNATLSKGPIENLIETISAKNSTFGRVAVVVDNNYSEAVASVAERKGSKERIYAYVVSPLNVLDFAYDDDGELNWILLAEIARDDGNPLTATGAERVRYRLWTKDFWALINVVQDGKGGPKRATLESSDTHKLGLVPVFFSDHVITDSLYTAPALIEDVAYLDRACANYLSNLDAIIQDQTFSQLVIPFQGLLPSGDESDDADDNDGSRATYTALYEMGTKRIFAYNAEGSAAPSYISPDPKQAGLVTSTISTIISEIYHSIGMAGERTKQDNALGIDNSSGVAKAYDFERLNAMLVSKAQSLELAEHNLVRLIMAWNGDTKELEDTKKYATYPATFDVRNLADEFDTAQRLSLMGAPRSLRQEHMRRMVAKMFPQLGESERAKIEKEIEDEWLEIEVDPVTAGRPDQKPGLPNHQNNQGQNNKSEAAA